MIYHYTRYTVAEQDRESRMNCHTPANNPLFYCAKGSSRVVSLCVYHIAHKRPDRTERVRVYLRVGTVSVAANNVAVAEAAGVVNHHLT